MNFGKHGRTVLLAALFGSTSALVFGGMLPTVAGAESGTITLNGAKGDHLLGACVSITTSGFTSGRALPVTFSGEGPTKFSYADSTAANTTDTFDLSDALTGVKYNTKDGVNLKVTIAGKNKSFWIADPGASCGSTPAASQAPKGKAAKHKVKPGPTASTTSTCQENSFLDTMSPAAGSTIQAGSTVSVVYNDESPLYQPSLKVTFGPNDVTRDVVLSAGPAGKEKYSTRISYTVPSTVVDDTYAVTIYAQDSDQNKAGGDCGRAAWSFAVIGGGNPPPNNPQTCTANNKLLGQMVNPSSVTAGDGVGWTYKGQNPLDVDTIVFTFDGQQVDPTIFPQTDGSVDIVYVTPTATPTGAYTATLTVQDTTQSCSSATANLTLNNPWGVGTT